MAQAAGALYWGGRAGFMNLSRSRAPTANKMLNGCRGGLRAGCGLKPQNE